MTAEQIYAAALADAILGSAIFFICFCRIVVSSKKVVGRVRLKYILLGPTALMFGWSMLWGDMPGLVSPILMIAVLVGLLTETWQWKKGPPDNVRLDTMPDDLRENL